MKKNRRVRQSSEDAKNTNLKMLPRHHSQSRDTNYQLEPGKQTASNNDKRFTNKVEGMRVGG